MLLNQYIDHTILKPTTLISEIEKLCKEAKKYQFAAVCVPPVFVGRAKKLLIGSSVKIATVIGFPFGYSAVEAKIAEILLALIDGADEFDIVINLIALKNNDWVFLANELNHIMPIIKQKSKVVKIIIESGILTEDEIVKCCELYGIAGVDYLKTSTGYASTGATIADVELMRKYLPVQVGVKASGGIKTFEFANQLILAGATRIGSSSGVELMRGATLN